MHPIEAQIARGKLESEGIPAFLLPQHHAQLDWPLILALGGIKLQVPPAAAQEAVAILASLGSAGDVSADDACSGCGDRAASTRPLWRLAMLVVHLTNTPIPFSVGKRGCRSCGARCV